MVYALYEKRGRGVGNGGTNMKVTHITLPASDEQLAQLEIGSIVYLSGVVYTAREGVYKKIIEEGEQLPLDNLSQLTNANFHCSPALAPEDDGSYRVGAVTATASFRFSKWMDEWLKRTQTKIVIGKGGMPNEDYKNLFVPHGAVYLTTVGYGTGALLGRGVEKVREVFWLEELGIAQAMWLFEVKDLGPFIVESDLSGRSLFHEHGEKVNKNIEQLYADLKQPALHRYGETINRKDEVM